MRAIVVCALALLDVTRGGYYSNMKRMDIGENDLQMFREAGFGEPISASWLASGANNEIILVEFQSKKIVLKKTLGKGVNRLGNEREILRMLRGECAPQLIGAKNDECSGELESLLMEFIPGTPLFEMDEQAAVAFGSALRQVHSTCITESGGLLEKPSWEEYYRNRLLTQFEFAKDKAPHSLCQEMGRLLQKIQGLGFRIADKPHEMQRVLIHSDLIPLNVIQGIQECKIIDWELGRIDFPEWDLCSVEKAFRFTKESKAAFYRAYQKEWDPSRFKLISLMHYSNVALWRMCSFYGRGENQKIKEKFLAELDQEIQWIRENIP